MKADIVIFHGSSAQYPMAVGGAELSLERRGAPGKLTFTVIKDGALNFQEGDACKLAVDGKDMFYGYVFSKKRRGSGGTIDVTAYDQLRYLKNKDTLQYADKTATEVVRMLAEDYKLSLGELDDTGYKIAGRDEDGAPLFDIILNALDATTTATGRMYILYDDAGKLTLKEASALRLDLLLDADTLGDFDYKSSIDDATYNQVKVSHNDGEGGQVTSCTVRDGGNVNAWGVLQLTDTADGAGSLKARAEGLLRLHNTRTRTLSASGVLGDTRVRAGSVLPVMLALGDIDVANYMMAESVKHTFNEQEHLMALKLIGGTFIV